MVPKIESCNHHYHKISS